MELKHAYQDKLKELYPGFNRTFMELKRSTLQA